ncbi:MAG: hypothetical protein GOVbin631_25 [Prokaryotic dsDNA virus sp.]|nr:MAG: hypothetical protein GOVbin631_25 [Prokaryotic dsDNA virus sp.]|tara:strand:- start:10180 stop:10419 length:240 start_codon:yes stop_codon:yes gene_type:complete
MKLPIRKIKNVWLRRAAIVPAVAVSFIVSVPILFVAGVLLLSVDLFNSVKSCLNALWREFCVDIIERIKIVWSKDFKNE